MTTSFTIQELAYAWTPRTLAQRSTIIVAEGLFNQRSRRPVLSMGLLQFGLHLSTEDDVIRHRLYEPLDRAPQLCSFLIGPIEVRRKHVTSSSSIVNFIDIEITSSSRTNFARITCNVRTRDYGLSPRFHNSYSKRHLPVKNEAPKTR
jgi:hypothetical protein